MYYPTSKRGLYVLVIFISLGYLIIIGGISFGMYCWYMQYYYKLKEKNELPIIVGFGTDHIKEDYLYNPSLYFCRPYYIVDYKYSDKTYS